MRSIELGIQARDRVAIYMPMIPEAAIAMLACARIGAVALSCLRWFFCRCVVVIEFKMQMQS